MPPTSLKDVLQPASLGYTRVLTTIQVDVNIDDLGNVRIECVREDKDLGMKAILPRKTYWTEEYRWDRLTVGSPEEQRKWSLKSIVDGVDAPAEEYLRYIEGRASPEALEEEEQESTDEEKGDSDVSLPIPEVNSLDTTVEAEETFSSEEDERPPAPPPRVDSVTQQARQLGDIEETITETDNVSERTELVEAAEQQEAGEVVLRIVEPLDEAVLNTGIYTPEQESPDDIRDAPFETIPEEVTDQQVEEDVDAEEDEIQEEFQDASDDIVEDDVQLKSPVKRVRFHPDAIYVKEVREEEEGASLSPIPEEDTGKQIKEPETTHVGEKEDDSDVEDETQDTQISVEVDVHVSAEDEGEDTTHEAPLAEEEIMTDDDETTGSAADERDITSVEADVTEEGEHKEEEGGPSVEEAHEPDDEADEKETEENREETQSPDDKASMEEEEPLLPEEEAVEEEADLDESDQSSIPRESLGEEELQALLSDWDWDLEDDYDFPQLPKSPVGRQSAEPVVVEFKESFADIVKKTPPPPVEEETPSEDEQKTPTDDEPTDEDTEEKDIPSMGHEETPKEEVEEIEDQKTPSESDEEEPSREEDIETSQLAAPTPKKEMSTPDEAEDQESGGEDVSPPPCGDQPAEDEEDTQESSSSNEWHLSDYDVRDDDFPPLSSTRTPKSPVGRKAADTVTVELKESYAAVASKPPPVVAEPEPAEETEPIESLPSTQDSGQTEDVLPGVEDGQDESPTEEHVVPAVPLAKDMSEEPSPANTDDVEVPQEVVAEQETEVQSVSDKAESDDEGTKIPSEREEDKTDDEDNDGESLEAVRGDTPTDEDLSEKADFESSEKTEGDDSAGADTSSVGSTEQDLKSDDKSEEAVCDPQVETSAGDSQSEKEDDTEISQVQIDDNIKEEEVAPVDDSGDETVESDHEASGEETEEPDQEEENKRSPLQRQKAMSTGESIERQKSSRPGDTSDTDDALKTSSDIDEPEDQPNVKAVVTEETPGEEEETGDDDESTNKEEEKFEGTPSSSKTQESSDSEDDSGPAVDSGSKSLQEDKERQATGESTPEDDTNEQCGYAVTSADRECQPNIGASNEGKKDCTGGHCSSEPQAMSLPQSEISYSEQVAGPFLLPWARWEKIDDTYPRTVRRRPPSLELEAPVGEATAEATSPIQHGAEPMDRKVVCPATVSEGSHSADGDNTSATFNANLPASKEMHFCAISDTGKESTEGYLSPLGRPLPRSPRFESLSTLLQEANESTPRRSSASSASDASSEEGEDEVISEEEGEFDVPERAASPEGRRTRTDAWATSGGALYLGTATRMVRNQLPDIPEHSREDDSEASEYSQQDEVERPRQSAGEVDSHGAEDMHHREASNSDESDEELDPDELHYFDNETDEQEIMIEGTIPEGNPLYLRGSHGQSCAQEPICSKDDTGSDSSEEEGQTGAAKAYNRLSESQQKDSSDDEDCQNAPFQKLREDFVTSEHLREDMDSDQDEYQVTVSEKHLADKSAQKLIVITKDTGECEDQCHDKGSTESLESSGQSVEESSGHSDHDTSGEKKRRRRQKYGAQRAATEAIHHDPDSPTYISRMQFHFNRSQSAQTQSDSESDETLDTNDQVTDDTTTITAQVEETKSEHDKGLEDNSFNKTATGEVSWDAQANTNPSVQSKNKLKESDGGHAVSSDVLDDENRRRSAEYTDSSDSDSDADTTESEADSVLASPGHDGPSGPSGGEYRTPLSTVPVTSYFVTPGVPVTLDPTTSEHVEIPPMPTSPRHSWGMQANYSFEDHLPVTTGLLAPVIDGHVPVVQHHVQYDNLKHPLIPVLLDIGDKLSPEYSGETTSETCRRRESCPSPYDNLLEADLAEGEAQSGLSLENLEPMSCRCVAPPPDRKPFESPSEELELPPNPDFEPMECLCTHPQREARVVLSPKHSPRHSPQNVERCYEAISNTLATSRHNYVGLMRQKQDIGLLAEDETTVLNQCRSSHDDDSVGYVHEGGPVTRLQFATEDDRSSETSSPLSVHSTDLGTPPMLEEEFDDSPAFSPTRQTLDAFIPVSPPVREIRHPGKTQEAIQVPRARKVAEMGKPVHLEEESVNQLQGQSPTPTTNRDIEPRTPPGSLYFPYDRIHGPYPPQNQPSFILPDRRPQVKRETQSDDLQSTSPRPTSPVRTPTTSPVEKCVSPTYRRPKDVQQSKLPDDFPKLCSGKVRSMVDKFEGISKHEPPKSPLQTTNCPGSPEVPRSWERDVVSPPFSHHGSSPYYMSRRRTEETSPETETAKPQKVSKHNVDVSARRPLRSSEIVIEEEESMVASSEYGVEFSSPTKESEVEKVLVYGYEVEWDIPELQVCFSPREGFDDEDSVSDDVTISSLTETDGEGGVSPSLSSLEEYILDPSRILGRPLSFTELPMSPVEEEQEESPVEGSTSSETYVKYIL